MFVFMLHSTMRAVIGCALLIVAAGFLHAETNTFPVRAERAFNEARQAVQKDPTNSIALIHLARVAFDWAEFARNDEQREEIALQGIAATRAVIARESTNSAAHYWLGMDLGQLARTKTLGALKLVREMENEFHLARNFDAHTDYAGPDRSLAMLYRDAPGWPTSIGNKSKAREHFERAIKLHPEFPDNQLGLLESFQEWGEKNNFARQLPITEKTIAEARARFTGPHWDLSWADWSSRLAKMKRQSTSSGPEMLRKSAK
jgi:tetratricopeptide (TPR) repeat protein